jgi:G:T/U-mismatch repair DNA glycosylase
MANKVTVGTPEVHPLPSLLPPGARVLLLGSFPPPRARWSMDFYYPNPSNDFWRVMGLLFFADRDHFAAKDTGGAPVRGFDRALAETFCRQRGIALSDTALEVIRTSGNASDDMLRIVRRRDIAALLDDLPHCTAVATTGGKASETLFESLAEAGATLPPHGAGVGGFVEATLRGRPLRLWRLPSTSRAYPLALERKAEAYARMFSMEGVL